MKKLAACAYRTTEANSTAKESTAIVMTEDIRVNSNKQQQQQKTDTQPLQYSCTIFRRPKLSKCND